MTRLRTLLFIMVAVALAASARVPRVFFVNAYPGEEVYQLEGHSALVVDFGNGGEPLAFNYGVFDFHSPNFLYRFVKGETDYMLAAYPLTLFTAEYKHEGRRLVAHELNLDSIQATRLAEMLMENARPENCVYRYNYVLDNCATRPLRIAELAAGDSILLGAAPFEAQSLQKPTFRNVMRAYHANYPWYQFGIDVALGYGIDRPISRREISFAPVELDAMLASATVGGKKLVKESFVLNDLAPDAALCKPTPWHLTPMAAACLVLVLALLLTVRDFRRRKPTRWFDAALFGIYGIAGCVLTFLIFISVHEATSPNLLYVWLNPLCLLVPVLIYVRKASRFIGIYQGIYGTAVLLLMLLWPLLPQSANPAFFPLMAAAVIRAATDAFLSLKS